MRYIRGQVTIFIIVALLIIVGGILFFGLRNSQNSQKEVTNQNFPELPMKIETCITSVSLEGTNYLSKQGGFYSLENSSYLDYFGEKIPYYFLNKKNNPSLVNLELEFDSYLKENLPPCIESSLEELRLEDFNISTKEIKVNSEINKKGIKIKIKYPLEISKGIKSERFEEFEEFIESEFFFLWDISNKIVEEYSKNPQGVCITCLEELSLKNDLEIRTQFFKNPLKTSDKNEIILILSKNITKEDSLKWIFALKQIEN